MSINSTDIKKGKIDMHHNKTEKNSLEYYDNTNIEKNNSLNCNTINIPKTEKLDTEKIPKPKAISTAKEKQSNVEILSVVKTQVIIDPKNIFDKTCGVNSKEPFVLPKPNNIPNRKNTFRNEEELSSFLNSFVDDSDSN